MARRWLARDCGSLVSGCFMMLLATTVQAASDPTVVSDLAGQFQISQAGSNAGSVTQFVFGPDQRLYASTVDRGVVSFQYDAATGKLSDMKTASNISGLGIGFQKSTGQMYLSSMDGSIYRLTDDNHNGTWGEAAETRVAIVQNLPVGDHNVNNIQIVGNSLYVGIGNRTINGGTGLNTGGAIDDYGGKGMFSGGDGRTFGESAYNGTISWIKNLNAVASTTNAAGLFKDTSQATIQGDSSPYTSTDESKLVVHSAGTRNPFALAVDKSGNVFFANNYNRADTNGDGTATRGLYADAVGPHLKNQVYDQFFKATQGADYGFRNENWQNKADILTPGTPGYTLEKSITFDNLYSSDPHFLQDYDPAHPVGLGPSASPDGFAFSYSTLLSQDLYGDAFMARWNPSVSSSDGTTYSYADLVAIDPITGEMRRIAFNFTNPLAVIADAYGNLLVSDFGTGTVYVLRVIPEPASLVLLMTSVPLIAWSVVRRGKRRQGALSA